MNASPGPQTLRDGLWTFQSSGNSVAISATHLPGDQVLWFSILPRQEDLGTYSNMKTELIEATQGNTPSVETENP